MAAPAVALPEALAAAVVATPLYMAAVTETMVVAVVAVTPAAVVAAPTATALAGAEDPTTPEPAKTTAPDSNPDTDKLWFPGKPQTEFSPRHLCDKKPVQAWVPIFTTKPTKGSATFTMGELT
jgi:hypothetical protein